MAEDTPTPDTTTYDPSTVQWLPVTHRLVRRHDGSVISAHCCAASGTQALEDVTLAQMIGPDCPGPLERVWVDLVEVTTGDTIAFTGGLTPLNGEPTDVYSWP